MCRDARSLMSLSVMPWGQQLGGFGIYKHVDHVSVFVRNRYGSSLMEEAAPLIANTGYGWQFFFFFSTSLPPMSQGHFTHSATRWRPRTAAPGKSCNWKSAERCCWWHLVDVFCPKRLNIHTFRSSFGVRYLARRHVYMRTRGIKEDTGSAPEPTI